MDDKKLLFIYNPRAGKGQIRNNLLDIIDTFVKAGYVVTARPTQYAGEAVEIAADRTAKYDLVVCSGGDGTLDEVVTGIMKSVRRRPDRVYSGRQHKRFCAEPEYSEKYG